MKENVVTTIEILLTKHCHADSCFHKTLNSPPWDSTRKYDTLCMVAFNGIFEYDDVSKWTKKVILLVWNYLRYNLSKFGRKLITCKRDNLNWKKKKKNMKRRTPCNVCHIARLRGTQHLTMIRSFNFKIEGVFC